ncbi:MAG TPA: cytochrome c [Methylomirabilota bacterium]|nr:cytochrome c [Methylomirabilota bacterium]
MGRAWAIATLVVTVLLAAVGPARADEPLAPTLNAVSGARLFQSKGCAACHAINGAGGHLGPDLGRGAPPPSLYDLAAAMWNHMPGMAARIRATRGDKPYLTGDEMSDVTAYLYTAAVAGDGFLAVHGDVARGERLVSDRGCLGCHSLEPPHGRTAGSLDSLKGWGSPWTIVAVMWNHAFVMEISTQIDSGTWPRFTPGELADLVAFLRAHAYDSQR